ncbi:MAG: DUF370 domain-containing protein [Firmicutes bacterium]|nr:DUF370 domain-containing protein [Bacillota bacterium]
MYLHLGNDQVIAGDQVIVILNLELATAKQFDHIIETAQRSQQLINISKNDKKKALVVCNDRVYISPISSHTLLKRSSNYHREV